MSGVGETSQSHDTEQMAHVEAVGGRIETAVQGEGPGAETLGQYGAVGHVMDETTGVEVAEEIIGLGHGAIVAQRGRAIGPRRLPSPPVRVPRWGAMDAPSTQQHRPRRWALGAGIGFFVAMAIFWTLIFSGFFTHRNPDELYDTGWVASAGEICAGPAAAIRNLPNASTAKKPSDRTELLDRGTEVLEPMVDRLAALPTPTRESDRTVVSGFIEDWRIYLQDRRNFAQALLSDPGAQPLMSEVHGGWVSDAIDVMAKINDIIDCATPDDM